MEPLLKIRKEPAARRDGYVQERVLLAILDGNRRPGRIAGKTAKSVSQVYNALLKLKEKKEVVAYRRGSYDLTPAGAARAVQFAGQASGAQFGEWTPKLAATPERLPAPPPSVPATARKEEVDWQREYLNLTKELMEAVKHALKGKGE